jgi:beta-N-acetylhexosaminidase
MLQLMHSFQGYTVPQPVLDAVQAGQIAAFCLFAYNAQSPAQVRALTDQLRQAAAAGGHPQPIIGIDQEGGQLIAVTNGTTELPGNMALGATRSPELAFQAGQVLARELLAMGINLNFAPSLDVNVNPANPVIGLRSFGADAALVGALGGALIRGLQQEGVMAAAKHFPGHGDTHVDSHHSLPTVDHPRERLEATELSPFREALAAEVQSVISAHVVYPALDAEQPATLSRPILTDLLRKEWKYDGLILTDALDMHAVSVRGGPVVVEQALRAGVDLAMMGHLPGQLTMMQPMQPLLQADSVRRIRAAQARIPRQLPTLEVVGCTEHQVIAQAIADQSITVVKGQANLPLRLSPDATVSVITFTPRDLTPADTSSGVTVDLAGALGKRHPRVEALMLPAPLGSSDQDGALQAVAQSEVVLIGTLRADQDATQAALVQAIQARGQRVIVVALRTPYDLLAFPQVETYLCAYGIRPVTIEAVARVLMGEIPAWGVLPCPIPGLVTPLR